MPRSKERSSRPRRSCSLYPTALIGPGDPIVIPQIVTKCDYAEAELGVVLGATVRGVSKENALEAVVGYVVANDVSARDLQFLGRPVDEESPRTRSARSVLLSRLPMSPIHMRSGSARS